MITAGVDIGSVGTKAAILEDKAILATALMPTGSRPKVTAEMTLSKALTQANLKSEDLQHVISTGYGRRVVDFGEKTITEISACAQGIKFLGSAEGSIRTIIDLGGQDIKIISLDDEGSVIDFIMNDKCAAGTGRFLEVIARALEVDLDLLGELSMKSKQNININATCTVFAESEVISLLAQDVKKEDIISGIHDSIAERMFAMAKKIGMKERIAFTGGGAINKGLVHIMEKKLETSLFIPELPLFINSIGSAAVAQQLG